MRTSASVLENQNQLSQHMHFCQNSKLAGSVFSSAPPYWEGISQHALVDVQQLEFGPHPLSDKQQVAQSNTETEE